MRHLIKGAVAFRISSSVMFRGSLSELNSVAFMSTSMIGCEVIAYWGIVLFDGAEASEGTD